MTDAQQSVIDALAGRYIIRGRTPVFEPDTALELIQLLKERSLTVLGIHGFVITPTTTQPINYIDYSNCSGGVHEAAMDFIRAHRDEVTHFEIVFTD